MTLNPYHTSPEFPRTHLLQLYHMIPAFTYAPHHAPELLVAHQLSGTPPHHTTVHHVPQTYPAELTIRQNNHRYTPPYGRSLHSRLEIYTAPSQPLLMNETSQDLFFPVQYQTSGIIFFLTRAALEVNRYGIKPTFLKMSVGER